MLHLLMGNIFGMLFKYKLNGSVRQLYFREEELFDILGT